MAMVRKKVREKFQIGIPKEIGKNQPKQLIVVVFFNKILN